MESLGQIAYEAYGEKRNWQTVSGTPMPKWEDQDPDLRDAWDAAAQAVANVLNVNW